MNDKLVLMASKKKLMEAEIASKLEAQRTFPSSSNQASLDEALSRFKDLYADYGKQRKQEVRIRRMYNRTLAARSRLRFLFYFILSASSTGMTRLFLPSDLQRILFIANRRRVILSAHLLYLFFFEVKR